MVVKFFLSIFLIILFFPIVTISANTYYISTSGNDNNNGSSLSSAWSTFSKSWQVLMPGDTLLIADGTYKQSINPGVRNGKAGSPITIKAINDGKVIIDGEYQRLPVHFGDTWTGEGGENPVGNYFVLEGVIAKNSSEFVIKIHGHDNILRRVSAYNAEPGGNTALIGFLVNANNNLVEDCIAGGTGRKMIYTYGQNSMNNIVRRCFATWTEWTAAGMATVGHWPWGDVYEFYHGQNNIFENNIAYGISPSNGFKVQSQGDLTKGNKLLGDIAINIGLKYDGNSMTWPCPPPATSLERNCNQGVSDINGDGTVEWAGFRSGLHFASTDANVKVTDTLVQDSFFYGNAGAGITALGSGTNNVLNRVTALNNGRGVPKPYEGTGINLSSTQVSFFNGITDSKIGGTLYSNGGGAKLNYRYENGILQDGTNGTSTKNLWPWPMENRIKNELSTYLSSYVSSNPQMQNFSVTDTICEKILKVNGAVTNCYLSQVTPIPTFITSPSVTLSISPTINLKFDVNSDGKVNLLDVLAILNEIFK